MLRAVRRGKIYKRRGVLVRLMRLLTRCLTRSCRLSALLLVLPRLALPARATRSCRHKRRRRLQPLLLLQRQNGTGCRHGEALAKDGLMYRFKGGDQYDRKNWEPVS